MGEPRFQNVLNVLSSDGQIEDAHAAVCGDCARYPGEKENTALALSSSDHNIQNRTEQDHSGLIAGYPV
jgi:ribosome-binding protein aMBF1 (putative translation factor)